MAALQFCTRGTLVYNMDFSYLKGTVHHTDNIVELLVVQYGAILLNVETQLLSQTLAGCLAFQCTQCSWQCLLDERKTKREC